MTFFKISIRCLQDVNLKISIGINLIFDHECYSCYNTCFIFIIVYEKIQIYKHGASKRVLPEGDFNEVLPRETPKECSLEHIGHYDGVGNIKMFIF
jgi:hypothetical protein